MSDRTLLVGVVGGCAALAWYFYSQAADAAPLDDTATNVPDSTLDNASASLFGAILTLATRGYRNNNPGNLRTLPANRAYNGQIGDDNGYGIYDTMAHGVRAASQQLQKYSREGAVTVRQIITKWAPSSENNTASYIAYVSKRLNVSADTRLNVYSELPELCQAIFHHENGADGLKFSDITNWVYS